MNQAASAKSPIIDFEQQKQFEDRFVQLFPAIDKNSQGPRSAVLAVSEAVLNWCLVPVVEMTENGAENCAAEIKRLVDTVIGHVNEIQRQKIYFDFTREAAAGLKETTKRLKIVAEHTETVVFNQDKALMRFSVFFEDEDEKTETLKIAAV